jgi:hypothetical protein
MCCNFQLNTIIQQKFLEFLAEEFPSLINVTFDEGEEIEEVEVTHSMQLEGESGNSGKQSSGGNSNQAQVQAPETGMATTPHASETPSCIPIHQEKLAT